MLSCYNSKINLKLFSILAMLVTTLAPLTTVSADVFINSERTFTSLDGSAEDADGSADGKFSVNGKLLIGPNGQITCNDSLPLSTNADACPISITVTGSLEMQGSASIRAENLRASGSGGEINLEIGGSLLMAAGAIISSSKTTTGSAGIAGDILINVQDSLKIDNAAFISANNRTGNAGNIEIAAEGQILIDGAILSGPTSTLNSEADRHTAAVVKESSAAKQKGGAISLTSQTCDEPGILISANGIVLSQGKDPASDTISLEACRVQIDGLVASVAKQAVSDSESSPAVIIKADKGVTIRGQDLGMSGTQKGRVRADYIIGKDFVLNTVQIAANGPIEIHGPSSGLIYAVTANGGASSNQTAGSVAVHSNEEKVVLSGKAVRVAATAAGGRGGKISLSAKSELFLSNAMIQAIGSKTGSSGGQAGGEFSAFSCAGVISVLGTATIDVTGGTIANGKVKLQACGAINAGNLNVLPAQINPTLTSGVCGVCEVIDELPDCSEVCEECQEEVDLCGVCGGDDSTCVDCEGVPDGEAVEDECGVCGGDGSSCSECDDELGGEIDECGVCNGDGPDECGICGGDGESCLDCDGEAFGGLDYDECGICGGDGDTCNNVCEETDISLTLLELDNLAYKQKRLIDGIARELTKTAKRSGKKTLKKEQKAVAALKEEAELLYFDASSLAFELPSVITECENLDFCEEIDNTSTSEEYLSVSQQFYDLTNKILRRFKKFSEFKNGKGKQQVAKFRNKNESYLARNEEKIFEIPEVTVECLNGDFGEEDEGLNQRQLLEISKKLLQ